MAGPVIVPDPGVVAVPDYSQWYVVAGETELVGEFPDIVEPPCRFCRNFAPRREYAAGAQLQGMRLCWAQKQEFDYSCYIPREAK